MLHMREQLIAAVKALKARILFWDEVMAAIKESRKNRDSNSVKIPRLRETTRFIPGSNYGKNEQRYNETNTKKKLNVVPKKIDIK